MASQKYANLAQSTLASSYTAGDTTILLQAGDGSLFPSSGDFIVAIDDPPAFFLNCTSRTNDTLTVTSTGQEGTTAVNKASLTKVTQVITAGALDNIRIDMSGIGTYANLPVSGMKSGDRYVCTDSIYEFIYDGAAWQPRISGHPILTLPPTSSWSWDNQGSSVTDNSHGYEKSDFLIASAVNLRTRYRAAPGSTPYTLTALMKIDFSAEGRGMTDDMGWVFGFRDSSGKYVVYFMQINQGSNHNPQIAVGKWTTATSFSANYADSIQAPNTMAGTTAFAESLLGREYMWLRVKDDGANLLFSLSMNGIDWRQFDTRSRTDFFGSGPTQLCYGAYANSGGVSIQLVSWAIS